MQCSLSDNIRIFQGPGENESKTDSMSPDLGLHF